MKRYGIAKNARSRREIEAYLPDNYKVVYEYTSADGFDEDGNPYRSIEEPNTAHPVYPGFVIEGEDNAGWTLEGYVIPRLASALIWVKEIDLSHPIMKKVT